MGRGRGSESRVSCSRVGARRSSSLSEGESDASAGIDYVSASELEADGRRARWQDVLEWHVKRARAKRRQRTLKHPPCTTRTLKHCPLPGASAPRERDEEPPLLADEAAEHPREPRAVDNEPDRAAAPAGAREQPLARRCRALKVRQRDRRQRRHAAPTAAVAASIAAAVGGGGLAVRGGAAARRELGGEDRAERVADQVHRQRRAVAVVVVVAAAVVVVVAVIAIATIAALDGRRVCGAARRAAASVEQRR